MKTFFQTLYFILLIIIMSILLPSTITDYLSPNLKLFIAKVIIMITCLFFICLIISDIIKDIITKYDKLYNTLVQVYNHHVNTHNKVLDGLSVVKETSKNILSYKEILVSIKKQGIVNQDSLSSIRDNIRNVIQANLDNIRNVIQANLDLLSIVKDDKTNSTIISTLNIIQSNYDIINTNQLELLKSISELTTNPTKEDLFKLSTQLNIILDNQKYLAEQLVKSKRVSKTKV